MMPTRFPELAPLRISVEESVRERQRTAISEKLAESPPARIPLRRRFSMWLAALFAAGIPAVAIAAESSTPGELLYPVKLAVEPVRALFDAELPAEHRVEELERVVAEMPDSAEIGQLVDRAHRAVSEVDRGDLQARLDRVVDLLSDHRSPRPPDAQPPKSGPPPATDEPTTTDSGPARDTAGRRQTTTSTAHEDRPSDRPADGSTTATGQEQTTSIRTDEEPQPSDRPRSTPRDG